MIIGHQKQRQYLKRLAELDKIPHAFLFSGQDKVGKKTVALEFAKSLIGENEFRADQHPDLILVGLEPEASEIKINQIRDLIWKLSLKPYSASLKIAVVDGADKMTQDAQDCFLKTLEEPKEKTFLILIAEHPESLLPTILSRCQIIKFYPAAKEEMEKRFSKEISDLASGLPGLALEMSLDPQKLAAQKKMESDLKEAMAKDLAFRFQLAKVLAEGDNLQEILEAWQNCLRRNIFSEKNVAVLKNIQKIDYLIRTTNASQRLGLEVLMLEM